MRKHDENRQPLSWWTSNLLRGKFHRKPLGEVVNCSLGRRVAAHPRDCRLRRHRRNVDDTSFATRLHRLSEDLTGQHRTDNVQVENLLHGSGWHLEKAVRRTDRGGSDVAAGAVHQDVDLHPSASATQDGTNVENKKQ